MENFKINDKIIKKIENYDEEVQNILKKGILYTERAQLTRVKNRISRDIEKMAKESMK
ncbi:hypothetical protein [Paucisalibacillus globulus]|uniref:hypothetical protein n=1 Tax=Paucisalibacillus globulus TaxID=351095 RepID=UPI0015965A2C|nr:hypothetical protein [Paucisalibacillus globulus]